MLFGLFLALVFCNNNNNTVDSGWIRPDSGWWWDSGGSDCSPWIILQDTSGVRLTSLTMVAGATQTVVIKNGGNCDLEILDVSIGGDSEFTAGPPESTVIVPGGSTSLELSFAATEPDTYTADLVIESNDLFSPSTTLELTATVVADLAVDPAKVDLGAVEIGCGSPFQVQLTSTKGASLTEIQGLSSELQSTVTLPVALASEIQTAVSFAYSPTDEVADALTLTLLTETGTAQVEFSASGVATEKATETFTGDGTTAAFPLEKAPVVATIAVTVDSAAAEATFADGVVTLAAAPAEGAAVAVSYVVQPVCE